MHIESSAIVVNVLKSVYNRSIFLDSFTTGNGVEQMDKFNGIVEFKIKASVGSEVFPYTPKLTADGRLVNLHSNASISDICAYSEQDREAYNSAISELVDTDYIFIIGGLHYEGDLESLELMLNNVVPKYKHILSGVTEHHYGVKGTVTIVVYNYCTSGRVEDNNIKVHTEEFETVLSVIGEKIKTYDDGLTLCDMYILN